MFCKFLLYIEAIVVFLHYFQHFSCLPSSQQMSDKFNCSKMRFRCTKFCAVAEQSLHLLLKREAAFCVRISYVNHNTADLSHHKVRECWRWLHFHFSTFRQLLTPLANAVSVPVLQQLLVCSWTCVVASFLTILKIQNVSALTAGGKRVFLMLLEGDSLRFFLPHPSLLWVTINSVGYLTLITEVGLVFLKLCCSFEEREISYGWRNSFYLAHSWEVQSLSVG